MARLSDLQQLDEQSNPITFKVAAALKTQFEETERMRWANIENIQFASRQAPSTRLIKLHNEICNAAMVTMGAKNNDYATNEDAFKNFRRFGPKGILVRLDDKLCRLENIANQKEMRVSNETLRDTVEDAINYLILFYAMVTDEQGK